MMEMFTPRAREWFKDTFGAPTNVQREGWEAIAAGGDVLVSAPTGTGKTLTAFLYCLDALSRAESLPDETYILYLSPLKALGNDIRENLARPLAGLGLSARVRCGVRTGDTSAKDRSDMRKRPPHILITTPESLYLLLTTAGGQATLKTVRTVIIDELHAILSSKRGAHLAASLARLDALCPKRPQRIALSATVRPLETAAAFLSGGRGATIVAPTVEKRTEIRVELPAKDYQSLPEHSFWPAVAERAYEHSLKERTILAFADGRASCEKLAFGISTLAGKEAYARTHHGCVARDKRLDAEKQLKSGELKVLCATSSMELGIDVGEIDLVLQIGAPLSVSSLTQRAGRAGHAPGRVSRLIVYPKTESDALYAALSVCGARDGRIEKAHPVDMCLDVLAQHLVSMAAAGDYTVDEAVSILREAYPFRELTRETVEDVLRMLAGDFEHAREKPARARLLYDRINETVSGDAYTRMLALSSGGTIPDRGWFVVTLPDGTKLGEVDEEFTFEARLGDKFLLGAFAWRITQITRDRVIVEPTSGDGAQPPFWRGDATGRPLETGLYYGSLLRAWQQNPALLNKTPLTPDAAETVKRFLARQIEATGCVADDRTILLEHFRDEAGEHQLMIHSVFGRRVNRCLSMLLRAAAARETGCDVRGYDEEDGILLMLVGGLDVPDGLFDLVRASDMDELLPAMILREPVFSLSFRYAAGRALMMGVRKGARQPLWVQRLRGAEALSMAADDPTHPLMREASRECLSDMLDAKGAKEILSRVRSGEIRLVEIHRNAPSPMALPLRRQAEMELMYEAPIPTAALRASDRRVSQITPDRALLETPYAKPVDSPESLHARMMSEGDFEAGEIDAPLAFLTALGARVLYVEPGLWIAAEEAALYEGALDAEAETPNPSLMRVLRRCLRFRGAQDTISLATRYDLPTERVENALNALSEKGEIVPFEGGWAHAEAFEFARRVTISRRRQEIETAPRERFACLATHNLRPTDEAESQLAIALCGLSGFYAPVEMWEGVLLPRRVSLYRPKMLDAILARGEFGYALRFENDKTLVAFYPPEAFEGGEYTQTEREITPLGQSVLDILEAGGAMFDHAISAKLGHAPVNAELMRLAALGLVRADAFAPVRNADAPARRIGARPVSYGRWERARAPREMSGDEILALAFDQKQIVCRETLRGLPFSTALDILRNREYEGLLRRGYFVEGLSGAQFVRASDFERIRAFLAREHDDWTLVNAADPACLWGRALPHRPGREFTLLPSVVAVLRGGAVAAVLEKKGETLRVFDEGFANEIAVAIRDAFLAGEVFTSRTHLTVKTLPPCMADALLTAGFVREALSFVLYRL